MTRIADQCRAMGLQVGDTIEGTEGGGTSGGGQWYNTTRLTLLWLGKDEAVFSETSHSTSRPNWSKPEESTNWTLECREWRKVAP